MSKSEFNHHAKNYNKVLEENLELSGESVSYFSEYKIKDLHYEIVRRGINPHAPLKILDFGCGVGNSLQFARSYFPNSKFIGADTSDESIQIANTRHGDYVSLHSLDTHVLPSEICNLDVTYAMCVFHHIEPSHHISILKEIRNRMAKSGLLFIYEHNPFNPLTRHVVSSCPFDKNAVLIRAKLLASRCNAAGFINVDVRYRVFFPNFFSRIRGYERALSKLPVGCQYYLSCNP